MKLNHLDLQVTDVQAARAFFETFFDFHCSYARTELAILTDETGFELAISNLSKATEVQYPQDFHIGFVVAEVAQVQALYTHLKEAGYTMKFDLQKAGPNLAFQCLGPDQIPVEVRAALR